MIATPDGIRQSPAGPADPARNDAPAVVAPAGRVLLLAALPAVAVGVLLRVWTTRMPGPLVALNSDEALIGLQARELLGGTIQLMVAGNDYGSATEAYLVAPLMLFWGGEWPLRVVTSALYILAAYALYRLARLFFSRPAALVVALVGWTTSGALVLVSMRAWFGYPSGLAAQIAALALACCAMRSAPDRLVRIAGAAGLATGFALWSHPMFGAVAALAMLPPSVLHWRAVRRWWLPAAAGGLLGVSPWLIYVAGDGLPVPSEFSQSTFPERLWIFAAELLPRAFGVRLSNQGWAFPDPLAWVLAAVLVLGSLAGLVFLVARRGAAAVPILVAGVLAFPVLALFPQLNFAADGRYALPFLPELLMGLAAWLLLLPTRLRRSPWLVVVVPTAWSVALCVPVLGHEVNRSTAEPIRSPHEIVRELEERGIRYLRGEYWAVPVVDYLSEGAVAGRPGHPVRMRAQAAEVEQAPSSQVALVYYAGDDPSLLLPPSAYDVITVGGFDLYVPTAGSPDLG